MDKLEVNKILVAEKREKEKARKKELMERVAAAFRKKLDKYRDIDDQK